MKTTKFIFFLFILTLLSCNEDEENDGAISVSISSSGLSDGKLALNNEASFTAQVSGYEGDMSDLSYRWSLATGRGELTDGTSSLPNPTIMGNSVSCLGETAGEEEIIVQVLNTVSTTIAAASLDFEIATSIEPNDGYGCFDQPKIIYGQGTQFRVMNFDATGGQSLGISGTLSVAISPDGEWYAWSDDTWDGWQMTLVRCDGSDMTVIPESTDEDFEPDFSTDSQTLFFLRPHPLSESPGVNQARPEELVAYHIETGELEYITTYYQQDGRIRNYCVNPVTGEVAIIWAYEPSPGADEIFTLSIYDPETGSFSDFGTLPVSQGYRRGLAFSPDGGDIIFSGNTGQGRGIYRINMTDGSQPILLFPDPSPQSNAPAHPHYYANGSRIVWSGQENGTNSLNLWTIDANGTDMQQLTDLTGVISLHGVLE